MRGHIWTLPLSQDMTALFALRSSAIVCFSFSQLANVDKGQLRWLSSDIYSGSVLEMVLSFQAFDELTYLIAV